MEQSLATVDMVVPWLEQAMTTELQTLARQYKALDPAERGRLYETARDTLAMRLIALGLAREDALQQSEVLKQRVQQFELGDPIRARVEAHRQDRHVGTALYTPEAPVDDTETVAREYLTITPEPALTRRLRWLWGGVVFTGLADIATVCFTLRQLFVDSMGFFNGSVVELLFASTLTLMAYILIGVLWEQGRPRGALALYGFVLFCMALALLQIGQPAIDALWEVFSGVLWHGWSQTDMQATPPLPFRLGCAALFAVVLSLPGVLFLILKRYLRDAYRVRLGRSVCLTVTGWADASRALQQQAQQLASQAQHYQKPEQGARALDAAIRHADRTYAALIFTQEQEALTTARAVRSPQAAKRRATLLLRAAQCCHQSLHRHGTQQAIAVLFSLLVGLWTPAQAGTLSNQARTLREAAPSFVVLVDCSKSSPATRADFVEGMFLVLEDRLSRMPLGTQVMVLMVGDARKMRQSWVTRLQARKTVHGAPLKEVQRALFTLLQAMPATIKTDEHDRSELMGGFFEASRVLNPKASVPNEIIALTDLIEDDPTGVNCHNPKTCALPDPKFTLAHTSVTVIGAGMKLPAHQAQRLIFTWEAWFKKAGAVRLDVRR